MERCELIDRTKVLAKVKGLDPTKVTCEFLPVCDGKTCELIGNSIIFPDNISTPKVTQTDRFYMRLMAHQDITNSNGNA